MSSFDKSIGARIRAYRKAFGLSQKALADQIGVRFQQVQKYENGSNRIAASRLEGIARALGVPVSRLLHDSNADVLQNDDCAELLDLFVQLPQHQRAEILFLLRSKSARLTADIVATNPITEQAPT